MEARLTTELGVPPRPDLSLLYREISTGRFSAVEHPLPLRQQDQAPAADEHKLVTVVFFEAMGATSVEPHLHQQMDRSFETFLDRSSSIGLDLAPAGRPSIGRVTD